MFGPRHYVPILRSKEGEMYALEHLRDDDRPCVTPLIEIVPSLFHGRIVNRVRLPDPPPDRVLFSQAKKLLRSCKYDPFFLDLQYLDGSVGEINSTHPLVFIRKYCSNFRLNMVPVVGLHGSAAFRSAVGGVVSGDKHGACLRLKWHDVVSRRLTAQIDLLLSELGLSTRDVDLMVDYGAELLDAPPAHDLLTRIPYIRGWRSFVLASGTFPKDLQDYRPGIYELARTDWIKWKGLSSGARLPRPPSYSDYAIQYGEYVEPVPGCNPSASVRYTLDESWLILRGEALRRKNKKEAGPGAEQWLGHAILLCDRPDFYGPTFSSGDEYIFIMSKKRSRPYGNPTTWIRAGLNHHMTVVARQLRRERDV